MATSVISNQVVSGGVFTVTATLRPGPGFRIDTETEVRRIETTTSDGTGAWTLTLERNSNIEPAGTWWDIEEELPQSISPIHHTFSIIVGASNQNVHDAIAPILPTGYGAGILQDILSSLGDLIVGDISGVATRFPTTGGINGYALLLDSSRPLGVRWGPISSTALASLGYKNVMDYGATGLGVVDDATAFTNAAAAGGPVLVPPGTYLIDTDVYMTTDLIALEGASIKVNTTNKFTFDYRAHVQAGLYQIFNLSLGGTVHGLMTAYAEWFGSVGDGIELDSITIASGALSNLTVNTPGFVWPSNIAGREIVIIGGASAIGDSTTNGAITLPTSTITVTDGTQFNAGSGLVWVNGQLVSHSGRAGNDLTGCLGGEGAVPTLTPISNIGAVPSAGSGYDHASRHVTTVLARVSDTEITLAAASGAPITNGKAVVTGTDNVQAWINCRSSIRDGGTIKFGPGVHDAARDTTTVIPTDGVTTNGSKTVTCASANFTQRDLGRPLKTSGLSIPVGAGAWVAKVVSPTVIESSVASAASESGLTVTLSSHEGLLPLSYRKDITVEGVSEEVTKLRVKPNTSITSRTAVIHPLYCDGVTIRALEAIGSKMTVSATNTSEQDFGINIESSKRVRIDCNTRDAYGDGVRFLGLPSTAAGTRTIVGQVEDVEVRGTHSDHWRCIFSWQRGVYDVRLVAPKVHSDCMLSGGVIHSEPSGTGGSPADVLIDGLIHTQDGGGTTPYSESVRLESIAHANDRNDNWKFINCVFRGSAYVNSSDNITFDNTIIEGAAASLALDVVGNCANFRFINGSKIRGRYSANPVIRTERSSTYVPVGTQVLDSEITNLIAGQSTTGAMGVDLVDPHKATVQRNKIKGFGEGIGVYARTTTTTDYTVHRNINIDDNDIFNGSGAGVQWFIHNTTNTYQDCSADRNRIYDDQGVPTLTSGIVLANPGAGSANWLLHTSFALNKFGPEITTPISLVVSQPYVAVGGNPRHVADFIVTGSTSPISPEGVIPAPFGATARVIGTSTGAIFWVKESGLIGTSTGWVAK